MLTQKLAVRAQRRPSPSWAVPFFCSVFVFAGGSLCAAPPEEAGLSELDRKLLEGLGDDLLDDLPDLSPKPKNKTKPASPTAEGEPPQPERETIEQTKQPDNRKGRAAQPAEKRDGGDSANGEAADAEASASESDHPLARIGRAMRNVEQRIAEHDASDATQHQQQQIVAQLDELIKQAQQQRDSQSQSAAQSQQASRRSKIKQGPQQAGRKPAEGAGNTAQRPARDSSERLGPDETRQVEMEQLRDLVKDVWGTLPERMREQMNQDAVEEFLPKYRFEIEEYFRRLAEEEPKR